MMGWNLQTSRNEVEQHATRLASKSIRISALTGDLDRAALSEVQCKRVYGAHVYVSLPAFALLASRVYDIEGGESYQELTRALHLYQREVFRIVRLFGGYVVHFQGPKLHAVLYKPIGDGTTIATHAALLQIVLNDFVHRVFHEVFPRYEMLTTASGADLGTTIATANGQRNDRELLFIGSPANYAAKIINNEDEYPRITYSVYQSLRKDLRELFSPVREQSTLPGNVYRLCDVDTRQLEHLLQTHDIAWKPDTSIKILKQAKKEITLADIDHRSEHALINLKELSVYNNRRVFAASLFADLSGFTRYVEQHEHTTEQDAAMRLLHAVRREMSRVVRDDYGGLRIQFQGDRVQALFHMPKGDACAIVMQTVDAAIGLQFSMGYVLKRHYSDLMASLHLAIGIDLGATLVSRLNGVRQLHDPICLGRAVERAAMLEETCEGGQIGVTRRVYRALPEERRHLFAYDRSKQCYVGTGLTFTTAIEHGLA
jgi:class 3 adenylate cyclase